MLLTLAALAPLWLPEADAAAALAEAPPLPLPLPLPLAFPLADDAVAAGADDAVTVVDTEGLAAATGADVVGAAGAALGTVRLLLLLLALALSTGAAAAWVAEFWGWGCGGEQHTSRVSWQQQWGTPTQSCDTAQT